jgi:hypothetical protein
VEIIAPESNATRSFFVLGILRSDIFISPSGKSIAKDPVSKHKAESKI